MGSLRMQPNIPSRNWLFRRLFLASLLLASPFLASCGGRLVDAENYGWIDDSERPTVRSAKLSIRWARKLVPELSGSYVPVEKAVASFDAQGKRVYVGSSAGTLWALTQDGNRVYRFPAGAPIEASPAVDGRADELYVGTTEGMLHAIRAQSGAFRWRVKVGGPVGQKPLLSRDAVYVVTDNDKVSALARKDGEVLWRYARQVPEGFTIAGHAGVVRQGKWIVTGFSDGVVAALDAGDGRVAWERNIAIDIVDMGGEGPRLLDVDTTPVAVGDAVYVASFGGGLYALSASNGTVLWRDVELTGITNVRRSGRYLVLSSADRGVVCMDLRDRRVMWTRAVRRGAAGAPEVARGEVYVGESQGAFLALSLRTGHEIARMEFGHGFSAPASLSGGRGFVLSNGGTLLAFNY